MEQQKLKKQYLRIECHVKELNSMGANITVRDNIATVVGVKNLQGKVVMGSDLRATAALALAGLSASGITKVRGLEHLERGYENFSQNCKLEQNIQKIKIMFKMSNLLIKVILK